MQLNLDRYNEKVKDWTRGALENMKSEGEGMGIKHRPDSPSKGASLKKLKNGFKEQDGAIAVVSFKFPRVLIYTHKGAGKGRGGLKGSKWVDKFGNSKTTNSKSLGKAGAGGRVEKPFINNILESETGVEELGTIAAEEMGDALINNMLI